MVGETTQIVYTLLLEDDFSFSVFPKSLSQDAKHSAEIVTSPSLDVFLPEDEDNPYESVTTAVTRKPCSLDINRLNACPRNGRSLKLTLEAVSLLKSFLIPGCKEVSYHFL